KSAENALDRARRKLRLCAARVVNGLIWLVRRPAEHPATGMLLGSSLIVILCFCQSAIPGRAATPVSPPREAVAAPRPGPAVALGDPEAQLPPPAAVVPRPAASHLASAIPTPPAQQQPRLPPGIKQQQPKQGTVIGVGQASVF